MEDVNQKKELENLSIQEKQEYFNLALRRESFTTLKIIEYSPNIYHGDFKDYCYPLGLNKDYFDLYHKIAPILVSNLSSIIENHYVRFNDPDSNQDPVYYYKIKLKDLDNAIKKELTRQKDIESLNRFNQAIQTFKNKIKLERALILGAEI